MDLKATLFSSRRLGLGSKLKFLEVLVLVLPRLMYGAAESWALTEAQGTLRGHTRRCKNL